METKTLYLDCLSGIAGDMMLGALIDAGASLEAIQQGIDSLGLGPCRLRVEPTKRHGFRALNLQVEHPEQHAHRHLHQITEMIDGSRLSESQKELAKRIFIRLGQAEAQVHGTTIEKVHFHEVGAVDSIADIVGTAIAVSMLEVERVVCSPVPTGCGVIQIAHGRCQVPAPATAELLRGVPLAASDLPYELTTPTGAAIVATLADAFGPLPAMTIDQIGYGAGDRDLAEQANLLRVFLGRTSPHGGRAAEPCVEQVWVLETNLDDVSGEVIGDCIVQLWQLQVLDVFTTPVQMKKNRPGVQLTVLCGENQLSAVECCLFAHTGTLGIRRSLRQRRTLPRETVHVQTPWGTVEGKKVQLPDGTSRFIPEYESCRELAERSGRPVWEVMAVAKSGGIG